MKVTVNDKTIDVAEGCTVKDVLKAIPQMPKAGFALAVDSDVVPQSEWSTHKVSDGAQITVIKAFYGG